MFKVTIFENKILCLLITTKQLYTLMLQHKTSTILNSGHTHSSHSTIILHQNT